MDKTTLDALLDRRVWLITGKGGVGRTAISAAAALFAARKNRRVLLTEIGDPAEHLSPLARVFGRDLLPEGEPAPIAEGLLGVQLLALPRGRACAQHRNLALRKAEATIRGWRHVKYREARLVVAEHDRLHRSVNGGRRLSSFFFLRSIHRQRFYHIFPPSASG